MRLYARCSRRRRFSGWRVASSAGCSADASEPRPAVAGSLDSRGSAVGSQSARFPPPKPYAPTNSCGRAAPRGTAQHDIQLTSKTAIVTGAGSGIGRPSALLSRSTSARGGARRAEAPAKAWRRDRALGAEHKCTCDSPSHAQSRTAFEAIGRRGATAFDVMVNNAGIAHVGTLLSTAEQASTAPTPSTVKGLYSVPRGRPFA